MDSPLRMYNSESSLLERRADILMTLQPEELNNLDAIERKLQNLYERDEYLPYESNSEGEVEYDEDEEGPVEQWLYDPVNSDESGEPEPVIREKGNGEWENELRRITQHDTMKEATQNAACCNKVKDNTLPDKRLCIPGRCECPLIPAMLPDEEETLRRRYDTINELAWEGATYEEKADGYWYYGGYCSMEQAENLMIEADEKEDDIENEIINVFAEDHDRSVETQHDEARLGMIKLHGGLEKLLKRRMNLLKRGVFRKFCLSSGFNECDRCLKFCKELYSETEEQLCSDCLLTPAEEETDTDDAVSGDDTLVPPLSLVSYARPKKKYEKEKYEKEKYAIRLNMLSSKHFTKKALYEELPASPQFPSLARKKYHDKGDLHKRIPGNVPFVFETIKVGSTRMGDRLLFTLTEAKRICALRNKGAKKAELIKLRVRKRQSDNAVESMQNSIGKPQRRWRRRVTVHANYKVKDSSHRFATSSSFNSSCTYMYPTDLQHIIEGVSRWYCPIDNCQKNITSMALNGKKHDFQKGMNLKRHLVDVHNCQLVDVYGKHMPKYKYQCYHPECQKKVRYVGSNMFIGIKPFHDISQYRRHLSKVHHRTIVKTDGTFHVKGHRDHVISENYEEVTDKCKWWEKPNDCSCWHVPDDCDCKNCSVRKYKRRKI